MGCQTARLSVPSVPSEPTRHTVTDIFTIGEKANSQLNGDFAREKKLTLLSL